jgi:hypothetical protein
MNRKFILVTASLYLLLISCSQQSLIRMTVKTPKVDYKRQLDLTLSDFHKDAIYTEIIKNTYPRLYDKVPDFDEQSKRFIQNSSLVGTEKKFDIVLKKFMAILTDGHSNYVIDFNKYDKTRYGIFLYKERDSWVIGNIDKEIDSTVIGLK